MSHAHAHAPFGTDEPEDRREVVLERVFQAPAALLYAAWSTPAYIKRWFGPGDWPLTHVEMDFRVGGTFRFRMTGPDGVVGPPFGGRYLELIEGRRIVYDNGFLEPGGPTPPSEKMRITIDLTPRPGIDGAEATHLRMHTLFWSVSMYEVHTGAGYVGGVTLGFDQLDAALPQIAASRA